MRLFAICLAVSAWACAPLRSAPLAELGPPQYARVTGQRQLELRAGETAAERAVWAMLSRDPAIVAAAVLGVEDDHGRSRIWEYALAMPDGGIVIVRSRYIVSTGQCVLLRRVSGEERVLLVAQDEARCAVRPN